MWRYFVFYNDNLCCDSLLEPFRQDRSNEESQNMFLFTNIENSPKITPVIPSNLEHYYINYFIYIIFLNLSLLAFLFLFILVKL